MNLLSECQYCWSLGVLQDAKDYRQSEPGGTGRSQQSRFLVRDGRSIKMKTSSCADAGLTDKRDAAPLMSR